MITIVAIELQRYLRELDCRVMGPYASVRSAMGFLEQQVPDHAILDLHLQDGLSYPIADRLSDLGVPFTFITSSVRAISEKDYDADVIQKPYKAKILKFKLADTIRR